MTDQELLAAASEVRRHAHAPYSGYAVGAAVLDESGAVHVGCNVENASYPEGICAEANAIGSMVAAGGSRISAIAVVGGVDESGAGKRQFAAVSECTPCGGCRQRIAEFADATTRVILLDANGDRRVSTIDELLPRSFGIHG
jgi:cytidine deaminase